MVSWRATGALLFSRMGLWSKMLNRIGFIQVLTSRRIKSFYEIVVNLVATRRNRRTIKILLFWHAAAVFGLFAAGGEPFVGIGFGGHIIGVISAIGYQRLDILYIGPFGQIGDGRRFLFVVHIDLYDPVLVAHIVLDPRFAHFSLNG